jgi:curved DNA-binding protein CbpA
MLGITPDASREQVVRAWRRRARAEHPDSRPGDAAAPDRFRAVAEAYRVLSDPARRAAYDLASGHRAGPGQGTGQIQGTGQGAGRAGSGPGRPGRPGRAGSAPRWPAPGVPLHAGPVRIDPLPPDPARGQPGAPGLHSIPGLHDAPGNWQEGDLLAELVIGYLARWGRPW